MLTIFEVEVRRCDFELSLCMLRVAGCKLLEQRLRLLDASKLTQTCEQNSDAEIGATRTDGKLAVMGCLLIVLPVIMSQRNETHKASRLRIVGVQAETAQQGIESFREMTDVNAHEAQGKKAQREIWVEINRTLRLRESPRMHVSEQIRPAEGVVAVRVAVVERDCAGRSYINL